MNPRTALLVGLLTISPGLALADASVAGQWESENLGDNAKIAMDILADGHWYSQTVHDNTVIATMSGTYVQEKQSSTAGILTFTPVTADTSSAHGTPEIEHDQYKLSANNTILRLTNKKDGMTFRKQNSE